MVQCPVGFRCKSCSKVESKLTSVTPVLVAKSLGVCAATGFAFGHIMPWIGVPFFSCVICYFLGFFAGRLLIARVVDYKLGRSIGLTIVFGLLIGMSLTDVGALPMAWLTILQATVFSGKEIFNGLTFIVSSLFCPVAFVLGVLRETVWGARW